MLLNMQLHGSSKAELSPESHYFVVDEKLVFSFDPRDGNAHQNFETTLLSTKGNMTQPLKVKHGS